MHIPSERVYNKMRAEAASIWYVPANNGEDIAVLIKAPTPTLKAMVSGCSIKLLFGKKDNYLCTGVRIEDMPDTPLLLSGAQIVLEEHETLFELLNRKNSPLFLFNEMDICVASSSINLLEKDISSLRVLLGGQSSLYVGEFNADVSFALDCFVSSIDTTKIYPNAHNIPFVEVVPNIDVWKSNNICFIGNDTCCDMNISSKNEGANFENTIWSSLESVFPNTLHKSPQIRQGEKTREFTDVLAHYENGSFLIEAKDLSVIKAGFNKEETKRLSGIQKQVKKAIKQLVGATKAFKQGSVLLDTKGNEINVDRSIPPHCIILIAELMTCGDWDEITQQILEAIKQTGAFFHLLDFREFVVLLKQSSGDSKLIDYNLLERCKLLREKKSIFIRGI